MKKIFLSRIFGIVLSALFPLFLAAQNPTYTLDLRNDVQVSSTVYEFDIYLLRTGTTAFEYASGNYGILINPLIKNGGTVTASMVAGSSDPVLEAKNQDPNSVDFYDAFNVIRVSAGSIVGAGNGSLISNVSPGTRICRVRLSNTVAFGQFQPNLTWTTTLYYPTQVYAYVGGTNTKITTPSTHTTIYLNNPVLNPPLSVTPTATPGTVCAGDNVQLNAGASGGSGSYTYTWTSAPAGFNSSLANPIANPTVNTTYNVQVYDGISTVNASTPLVTVNPLPTVTAASVTPTSVCGSGQVVFSGTASSGSIKWYTASTGGTEIFVLNPTISSTTTYYAEAVSAAGCLSAARTPVTATVIPTPSAPTGSATQTYCSATSPTIANLVASGTLIQWYAASSGGSALVSTTALVNGTHYYASQTVTGCESTSRLDVTAVVNTTPSAPTGSATQTFCSGSSPTVVNLVASGTLIQWYAASTGGTALLSTTALVNGTHYYASQTVTGCESTSRLDVTAVVNTTPGAPTGSATQTFCSGSSPTVANLTASGTSIQWYAASSGGSALLSTTALVNGTHYYASQTVNGCESTSRLNVTAVVNTTPSAPTGIATQTFCSVTSPTIANLVASGTLIQWYAASSGGSALLSTTPLVNGTHYYASQTVTGCESTSRLDVTAVVNTTPSAPTGSATQTFCSGSSPTVANLTASGTSIQWYLASSGGSALLSTTALVNGTHYYASQTVNGCESTSRLDVTAVVNTTPSAPTGSSTQTFCSVTSPTIANLVASGTSIQWYAASSGGSALLSTTALVNGTHYYASQTVNGCESTSRLNVTAVVNTTPSAPTGSATQTFCSGTSPTVANLVASGTLIQWYAAATGGSALVINNSPCKWYALLCQPDSNRM